MKIVNVDESYSRTVQRKCLKEVIQDIMDSFKKDHVLSGDLKMKIDPSYSIGPYYIEVVYVEQKYFLGLIPYDTYNIALTIFECVDKEVKCEINFPQMYEILKEKIRRYTDISGAKKVKIVKNYE